MSRFHLTHCIPDPRIHGLNGYREVIDSIKWGLDQLGHETAYAINGADPSAVNIVFGVQTLALDDIKQLPGNSIIYNMEQVRNFTPSKLKPALRYAAERFEIWDYCSANLSVWQQCGAVRLKTVPVGYAPILTKIPKPAVQDIDVLMYGLTGEKRLRVLDKLCRYGLRTVFACGLYGDARDNLISRAKVVMNVNLYEFAPIFEIVRVSYLLANKKAVIACKDADTFIESDIESVVTFTDPERLVADCFGLVQHDELRRAAEERGYETFRQRDIRAILTSALAAF